MLSEIYKVLDDDIWRIVGKVSIKVKGLLEQRFKKIKGLGASSSNLGVSKQPASKTGASPRRSLNASLNKSFNPKN